MILKRLDFGSFMSYGPDNALALDGQGLVLIEGDNQDDPTVESNGAGKSGIFDALTWGLFGETLRGLKADDVVNRKTGKDCWVWVTFEDDKGRSYKVSRYRKHSEFKNALELHVDGKRMTHTDSDATQAAVTEALGMDFETFHHSVMFGQGFVNQFSGLTDKEKKAVIEKIIGVETISRAHKSVKASLTEKTEQVFRLKQDVEESDGSVNEEIEEMDSEQKSWKLKNTTEVAKTRDLILKAKVNDPKKVATLYRASKEDRDELRAKVMSLRAVEKVAIKATADAQALMRSIERGIERVEDDIERVEAFKSGKLGEVCRWCGGEVTKASSGAYANVLKAEESKFKEELSVAIGAFEASEKALKKATSDVSATQHKAEEADRRLEEWTLKMNDAERVTRKLQELEVTLKNLLSDTWYGAARLEKLKLKKAEVEKKVKAARIEIDKLEDEMKYLGFLEVMLSDKGKDNQPPLKGLLLDSVTPFLNKKASHYTRLLTAGAITVEFNAQSVLKSGQVRDRFEVVASNRYGAEGYEGNSGGEKRKIDVCVALALQSLAASRGSRQINVAFFDEVFESLDDTACDAVMELLVSETERYSSLFVITHQEGLKSYFPRSIRVVKRNGFSNLVE